jgi:prolyl oligopeptidase
VLRAYSPYHNIRAGVLYPPTLVIAGANDMRCPAWHARKFVARLQEVADGGPFVLRVMGGGHLSTRRGADLVAEWQGFLLKAVRAGLDG